MDSSLTNFLTYSCVFRIISIHSTNKTLWESLIYENIQKVQKAYKLILACMRRSKHVQSAWILVILINLTHFFVYFLFFLKKIFKKPFVYKYFFEKRKKHSHWFLLVVRLWRSRICLIFGENFRILWQILFLKSVFIFFHKKTTFPKMVKKIASEKCRTFQFFTVLKVWGGATFDPKILFFRAEAHFADP